MFKDVVLPICCLGLLGQSFSTHSRILFSSENFLYKIFITKNAQKTKMTNSRRTSRGPAVEKHCSKQIQLTILSALLTFFSTALFNNRHYAVGYQRHTQRIALLATACNWTHVLHLTNPFSRKASLGRVQLKSDGTRWRTGGEVKVKLAKGVSTLHTTSEHGVSSITTADAHTSAASCRLNWRPCLFNLYKPNVNYSWRTAPLTSKIAFYIFIQQI